MQAIEFYRAQFGPIPRSSRVPTYPDAGVIRDRRESEQEAARLATSLEQAIRQSPQRQAGAPPSAVGSDGAAAERAILDQVLACSAMALRRR